MHRALPIWRSVIDFAASEVQKQHVMCTTEGIQRTEFTRQRRTRVEELRRRIQPANRTYLNVSF
jgi:hypothetical protein